MDLHRKITEEIKRQQSTNQCAQGADFSHWNCLMDIFMEKGSQSQLLAVEVSDGLLELDPNPCLWHPKGAEPLLPMPSGGEGVPQPCRDAWGVSRGKAPAAGKRWIFPLPDQDSISYFNLILQTIKLLFTYSARKELKISQRWLRKGKTPGLMLLLFDVAVWVGDRVSFDLSV